MQQQQYMTQEQYNALLQQAQYEAALREQQYRAALQQQQYAAVQQRSVAPPQQYYAQPQVQQLTEMVTLPADAFPGKSYEMQTRDGRVVTFQVPQGGSPGMQIQVSY
mmetsp:Transcript_145054/g.263494  ORF Transcript_145054/g.263494 Transcript_145054/m.263494 type:complete len:107 (+) Transcript_145054:113-433(+)